MSNILFGIVVPVYNQEKYLDQCIKSVLEQEFTNYELILVNDGSTDSSGSICNNYANENKHIKVIHKENGGLVSARKAGASVTTAEYVIELDSDDYMAPGSLAYAADIIKRHSPDIISFGFVSFYEDATKKHFLPSFATGLYQGEKLDMIKSCALFDNRKSFFKFGIAPAIWANIMRRELYVNFQHTVDNRIKMGEDVCVSFPAILNCHSLYITDFSLVNYRILSTSISHSFRKNDLEDLKFLISHFQSIDLSIYDATNQFNVYVLYRVLCAVGNFTQHNSNYNNFLCYIKNLDKTITKCIKNIDKCTLPTKARFLLFMVNNKLWYFLHLLYTRRK